MGLPPHRVRNHVIDEKACKIVSLMFGEDWVERDITGRDFGIDKIVERFEEGYATSEILMLQIKGTEASIDVNFQFQQRYYYMLNGLQHHLY